jgi:Xaa-Pro aminopeptidase
MTTRAPMGGTVAPTGIPWRAPGELAGRREALRVRVEARGLDGAVVVGDAARTWLSGFDAASKDVVPTAAVLLGRDRAVLLTSANNTEWAASLAPGLDVETWKRPWWPDLAAHVSALGWRRVGFEADQLSVAGHAGLGAASGVEAMEDVTAEIDALRAVKSAAELATLRRAVELTDLAFVDATSGLQPGITERELAWRITQAMVAHGASRPGFPGIVAAGPHAARPHHDPTDHAIQPGEPVIIDIGADFGAYSGDLTRTIWLGEPDPRIRELYPIVARANEAAQAAVRAGATGRAVDAAGRDVIAAAGYGEQFVHGLGHGVGLEIHEAPSASTRSEDVLVAGNILTIEPGIYLPGWGGIRIEDFGAVTDDGFDRFSAAPYQSLD